jgi:hypothetical protein
VPYHHQATIRHSAAEDQARQDERATSEPEEHPGPPSGSVAHEDAAARLAVHELVDIELADAVDLDRRELQVAPLAGVLLRWRMLASAREADAVRKRLSVVPRPPSSAFAGHRFPPDVIMLAVRWYLRYGLPYRDIEETPRRTRHPRRSRHDLPVGPTLHAPAHRRRPAMPARSR